MFDAVLIANRGEIAVRISRTLRRLGIEACGVYAPADADAPHRRALDEAVPLPDAAAYRDIEAVIRAAQACGAQAIHPGYGFLAENAEAARACEAAGLTWIGPGPEAIARVADKGEAKRLAAQAGVPVVPGVRESADEEGTLSADAVYAFAEEQGYPLMIKAGAGGGGKGMRRVESADDLASALDVARREARAAFGAGHLIVERLIEPARHIEVQFAADAEGQVISLGERECSLQRRHQKLIEEAPSSAVSPALRQRLGQAAVELARAAGYCNLGTAEFLVDFNDPDRFYFLEINARLQVEHPVTEAVTGLDLVELQLAIAAGRPLDEELKGVAERPRGHAIEARICAERPAADFLPSTGRIEIYREAPGARVDSGIEQGSRVTADFDPMLAKVIVHAQDRDQALGKLRRALVKTVTLGVDTNADFLRWLLGRPEVEQGATTITTVEGLVGQGAYAAARQEALPAALVAAARACAQASGEPERTPSTGEGFGAADGWRLYGRGRGYWAVRDDDGREHELVADPDALGQATGEVASLVSSERVAVQGKFGTFAFDFIREVSEAAAAAGSLEAALPGVVLTVDARPGDAVEAGQTLLTLESMKMEIAVTAPEAGRVAAIAVAPGDHVARGQLLAEVTPLGDADAADAAGGDPSEFDVMGQRVEVGGER